MFIYHYMFVCVYICVCVCVSELSGIMVIIMKNGLEELSKYFTFVLIPLRKA